MPKGIVDVSINENKDPNSVALVLNCGYGPPSELHSIPDRAELLLKRGDKEHQTVFLHERGHECAYNYIELSPQTAGALGLKNGERYILDYSGTRTVTMERLATSAAPGLLLSETGKNKDGVIQIGYALLSKLGIPDTAAGRSITFAKGSVSKRLKLIVPENELDETFRLSPANQKAFGLTASKMWELAYNQLSGKLQIGKTNSNISSKNNHKSRKRRLVKKI